MVIPRLSEFAKKAFQQTQPVPKVIRTPLQSISTNITLYKTFSEMVKKPNLKFSFQKGLQWEKKQSNDHTSFLSYYLTPFTSIVSEPSIPDESTADKDTNSILLTEEEEPRTFGEEPTVLSIMRDLPEYQPLHIPIVRGRPNLPPRHYNPLQLFLKFFDWELLSIICYETNSYAHRTVQNPKGWKDITKIELLHYFGCLIKMGLYTQVNRKYVWNTHAVSGARPR